MSEKTTTKKQTVKKPTEVKKKLYELVDNCDLSKPQIMGLLVKAGLYHQYLDEKAKENKEIIPATITVSEFKKIIGE